MTGDIKRGKPYETFYYEPPIMGDNGTSIIGYEWSWKYEEDLSRRGDEIIRRVSDWQDSEYNQKTGHEIVHKFIVRYSDGTEEVVSLETALKIIGILENAKRDSIKSVVSATKTLAKQKVQLLCLNRQIEKYDQVWAEILKLEVPPVVNAGRQHKGKAWESTKFTMGNESIYQQEDTDLIRPNNLETLKRLWRSKQLCNNNDINKPRYYLEQEKSALEKRIARQEEKIKKLTNN